MVWRFKSWARRQRQWFLAIRGRGRAGTSVWLLPDGCQQIFRGLRGGLDRLKKGFYGAREEFLRGSGQVSTNSGEVSTRLRKGFYELRGGFYEAQGKFLRTQGRFLRGPREVSSRSRRGSRCLIGFYRAERRFLRG